MVNGQVEEVYAGHNVVKAFNREAVVSSVQLPTGDENDWLGKEPDIDEAAITETCLLYTSRCV